MIYQTQQGDMIDEICHRVLGDVNQVVAVWERNPQLVDQPLPLPAGILIDLPDPQPPKTEVKQVIADVWG